MDWVLLAMLLQYTLPSVSVESPCAYLTVARKWNSGIGIIITGTQSLKLANSIWNCIVWWAASFVGCDHTEYLRTVLVLLNFRWHRITSSPWALDFISVIFLWSFAYIKMQGCSPKLVLNTVPIFYEWKMASTSPYGPHSDTCAILATGDLHAGFLQCHFFGQSQVIPSLMSLLKALYQTCLLVLQKPLWLMGDANHYIPWECTP